MKTLFRRALFLFAIAVGVAHFLGYTGRACGWARAHVWPSDPRILTFFAPDTRALALIQVPLLDVDGAAGEALERLENDLHSVSGIRADREIDLLAFDGELRVARGRFEWERISESLKEHGYDLTSDHSATLERTGETIALAEEYALHGSKQSVEKALQRFDTAAKPGRIAKLLDRIGWRHAAFGAMILDDHQPSLAEVLGGDVKPRSIAAAIDFSASRVELTALLEAGGDDAFADVRASFSHKVLDGLDKLPVTTPSLQRLLERALR